MRLFDKRPLGLVLCIMLGGFAIFTRGGAFLRIIPIISALGLFSAFIISLINKKKKTILLVSAVGLSFSILASHLYFDNWFFKPLKFDEPVVIEATVLDEEKPTAYSNKYIIKTDTINGEPLSGYKLTLYVNKDMADDITTGCGIKFTCLIDDFSSEYASYSYGKGVSGICKDVSDLAVTDRDRYVPGAFFAHLRELISRHAMMLSDRESGSMISALLLGERDMLSDQVELDFRRIGISHILALSGLHLAIISLGLDKLLRLLCVNKNARTVLLIVFTLLYMTLTGFPVSVRRAGIMLILSNLLALFLRDNDSVTSLFVATFIICLTTPYSVYDVSLWLSAFATLGVVVYSELRANVEIKKKKHKILVGISESITVSAFAIVGTLLFTQFSFSGFSLISPLATLIFGILVEFIMYIGGLMLIIGSIIPLGWLITPLVRLTTSLSAFLSSLDVFVSKDYAFISVLVIAVSLLFFLFIILDIKYKKRAALVFAGLLAVLYITAGTLNYIQTLDDKVVYSSESKQDMFLIKSDGETALINSAKYSSTSAYNVIDMLEKQKIHKLDKYLVSHYSRSLSDELEVLLSNILVSRIHLPAPQNDEEKEILNKIYSSVDEYRTEIVLIKPSDTVSNGKYKIRMLYTVPYGIDTAQSVYMFYGEGRSYAYVSSGILNSGGKAIASDAIGQATDVIFGEHGKIYKNTYYFKAEYNNAKRFLFGSDNLIIPSSTTYYYIKNGCEIHSHPKEFVLAD